MDYVLNSLLPADNRYTFSDYFDLQIAARDIARGFGYTLEQQPIEIGRLAAEPDLSLLMRTLEVNQRRTRLENEQARRSALVAPTLVEVCEYNNLQLDTEYGVSVSPHLTGIVDYQIEGGGSLLVVEAKQSDLVRGFKQLAVELIALSLWRSSPSIVYGAVTDGERWQIALLDPETKIIRQDTEIYSIANLRELFSVLASITRK